MNLSTRPSSRSSTRNRRIPASLPPPYRACLVGFGRIAEQHRRFWHRPSNGANAAIHRLHDADSTGYSRPFAEFRKTVAGEERAHQRLVERTPGLDDIAIAGNVCLGESLQRSKFGSPPPGSHSGVQNTSHPSAARSRAFQIPPAVHRPYQLNFPFSGSEHATARRSADAIPIPLSSFRSSR